MLKKALFITIPIAVITILAIVVIYKAITVPATFDEVDTWWQHTGIHKIGEIITNPGGNTNNHILNSLAITFCQALFGVSLWTLRLPNLISFFFFSASTGLLAKRYFKNNLLLFCLPFACLFLNPYLLDFFGLARGYAMANAMMACSVCCMLFFSSSGSMRWYYLTIIFAALAAYANFALLIFWAVVHVFVVGSYLTKRYNLQHLKRTLAVTFFMGLAFTALCYIPVTGIQQIIKIGNGDCRSFYTNTVLTVSERFMYGKTLFGLTYHHVAFFSVIVLCAGGVNALLKLMRNPISAFTDAFNLVYLLLLLVLVLNLLQIHLSGSGYPVGRIGIFYYVLFIFVLIFLLRDLYLNNVPGSGISIGLISLLFVFHFTQSVTLKSVYEWSYDAYTFDVIHYLEKYRQQHSEVKTIHLKPGDSFSNSFVFYLKTHQLPWLTIHNPMEGIMINYPNDTTGEVVFVYQVPAYNAKPGAYKVLQQYRATGLWAPTADIRDASALQLLYTPD